MGYSQEMIVPKILEVSKDSSDEYWINLEREFGLTEWYINHSSGIEQGFTLKQPVAENRTGSLILQLEVNPSWNLVLSENKKSLLISNGSQRLSYEGLKVWDSLGKELKAEIQLDNNHQFSLLVQDKKAQYPVTIDGDILVIGAHLRDSAGYPGSGAAYVYEKSMSPDCLWAQTKKTDHERVFNHGRSFWCFC